MPPRTIQPTRKLPSEKREVDRRLTPSQMHPTDDTFKVPSRYANQGGVDREPTPTGPPPPFLDAVTSMRNPSYADFDYPKPVQEGSITGAPGSNGGPPRQVQDSLDQLRVQKEMERGPMGGPRQGRGGSGRGRGGNIANMPVGQSQVVDLPPRPEFIQGGDLGGGG